MVWACTFPLLAPRRGSWGAGCLRQLELAPEPGSSSGEACGPRPSTGVLAGGGGVGSRQSCVGLGPDSTYTTAGADEERGRGQAHECQKQRIFDQVLTLLVLNKVGKQRFHDCALLES